MPCQESGHMRGSVAALITVHGLLSFLSDVYGLLNLSDRGQNIKFYGYSAI